MKFLVVLALVAAASADPQWYSNFGYTSGVYSHGYGLNYASPLAYNSFYKPLSYHAVSPGVSHTVLKREAEAQYYPSIYSGYHHYPTVYNTAYASPYYGIKSTGLKTYSNDAVSPFNYAAKGRYVAHSAGATHIAKRDAEAQYIMPSVYSTAYTTPLAYKTAYTTPLAYSTPLVYNTPAVYHSAVAVPQMKTYSNDAAKPFNYAAKGTYHADSVGAKHIAKREAEAQFYSHAGFYNPYTRTSVHYPTTLYKPYSYIKYFH